MLIALFSVLGVVVVIAGVVGGYYLWLDAKVSGANERVPDDVWGVLADDAASEPVLESPDVMNILLLGSDSRGAFDPRSVTTTSPPSEVGEDPESGTITGSRSDTVILLHVDPANNYLSALSLPRDLRVRVDGYRGHYKLNFAYAMGGPALTIKTVQQVTGIDIDHYLEVDFRCFGEMLDDLGGVYLEVDRPYYYNGRQYEKIDLEPGYQLLDIEDALDYVRYRHDRNADFGRMERQQRFLSALRQQAMGWDLAFKLPDLVGTFFDYVTTDLGTNDFIDLAWWGIKLDGEHIRQVVLRGVYRMSDSVALVFCTDEEIAQAVHSLLTPPWKETAPGEAATTSGSSTTTTVARSTTTTESIPQSFPPVDPGDIPDPAAWAEVAKNASFAVEAPSWVPGDYKLAPRKGTDAYIYKIRVGTSMVPALVMLYQHRGVGTAGNPKFAEEYINVTETTWLEAPAACAGREVTYEGTVFTIVGSAGKVERVWWRSGDVLYWVSNSLSGVATEAELLAMAKSMIFIPAE